MRNSLLFSANMTATILLNKLQTIWEGITRQEGPPNTLAPGITKQSSSSYDIHAWHDGKDDENSNSTESRLFSSKSKQSNSYKIDGGQKEKHNRHFDLPFRHPKVRSLSNRMATTAFGSLPRRRAHTAPGKPPPPPSRSRSETYIHVPQASFDDDIQYSDEGSVYEQIEIVGESNELRFPWQRDVGIQCQKKYQNAEVQVNLMDTITCPQCGSQRSFSEVAINHHNNPEMFTNVHNSKHNTAYQNHVPKPPELMFNGLPDQEADDSDDITSKCRIRERPLSQPGIDQFDSIPWINTNVNSEAEAFINMKVKKENLRLNLPTEILESKSFPLSPCPSPHKQVRRAPPKVKPQVVVSTYDSEEDYDVQDILPGPLSERLSAFSTCSHDSSSSSSLRVPSPELLQTRATYTREKMDKREAVKTLLQSTDC